MNARDQLGGSFGAVLFTRAWPNRDVVDDFDEWQRIHHLPDLVALPGVGRADYYRTVEHGVPQVLQGSGNRIATYWSAGLGELLTFISDPGVAAAVEDGSQFFPHFNELDNETYTGNIYVLGRTVDGPAAASGDQVRLLFVQRYEHDPGRPDDLHRWIEEVHVPRLLGVSSVVAVRTGRAVRTDLSIPYYNSLGSDVVLTIVDGDVTAAAVDHDMLDALAEAQVWDRRLHYIRRELATLAFTEELAE